MKGSRYNARLLGKPPLIRFGPRELRMEGFFFFFFCIVVDVAVSCRLGCNRLHVEIIALRVK